MTGVQTCALPICMSDMWEDERPNIVGEGHVTDEVRADLLNLGWIVSTVEDE